MRLFHCTVVCGGGSPEALTFSSTGPCTWLLFSALRTVRFDIVLPLQVHNNGSCRPSIPIFRFVLQNFAIPGYFPYILFYSYIFSLLSWVGEGGSPSAMWVGPSIFYGHCRGCRIWDYVLHVEHISYVITNCGQHHQVIPSLFSIALWALLEENITRKWLSLSVSLDFPYILFYCYLSSLLSSGWVVIAVRGSISVQGAS